MGKKILMVTNSLGIGGAETHITELSCELKRRGYDVLVASNGGLYEEVLEQNGIKCFHAPLDKRSFSCMRDSYKVLGEIIEKEHPDIVHAHARIPGFVCGLLRKKYEFRFVTTAHWVFKVNPVLKLLSNWGEKSIAVSDDIKDYLIKNYGIKSENIFVTVNGIDTERFSKSASVDKAVKEFGLNLDKPIITYVSRLDEDRSLVARHLASIAPKLRKEFDGLQIIIVGAGNDFENVKVLADKANSECGCKFIFMAGGRSDIDNMIAPCDLFIGVSRSALEGMACEKPAIIAGNEGYCGIFCDDKLESCIKSNFCCRGEDAPNEDKLFDDIKTVLMANAETKACLANAGRECVLKNYSVAKMVNDYEACYKSLDL